MGLRPKWFMCNRLIIFELNIKSKIRKRYMEEIQRAGEIANMSGGEPHNHSR